MSDKMKTGQMGENLAADFLIAQGFEIVARNYRYKHAEIDLIVKKGNWLIFVEVKTRTSTHFGEPEAFVDEKKSRKILEGAEEYVHATNWQGNIRFDIISVTLSHEPKVEHFEDAFH
jgi:putative endonuclease